MTRNGLQTLCDSVPQADWQIGAECGIHPTAMSLYKTGRRPIHERHARALAEYFSVTVPMVLGDEPIPYDALVHVTEVAGPDLMPKEG